jgi:hypothetical protein
MPPPKGTFEYSEWIRKRTGKNNPNYGKHLSDEVKEKISNARKGSKMPPRSEEYRRKISLIHKGKIVSEEQKRKQSEAMMGRPSPRKGVHLSEETKQKLRDFNTGKKLSDETKLKISLAGKGKPCWNKGKKYSSPKQSIAMSGSGNSNWKGGISYAPYPQDWCDDLREAIRKRDGYICQECGLHQDELGGFHKQLDVHHIDYDKDNLNPINLISLCKSCHAKTNFNREYFKEKYEG